MKKYNTTLILVIFIISNISAQTYSIKESTLIWTGKAAFNSYELSGTLKTQSGFIEIKGNHITHLEITVDMNSLNHENSDLKKHLKSKDFFHVKRYKTAIFKLEEPVNIISNEAKLKGTLTIKGISITKSIIAIIQTGDKKIIFKTKINRVNYGVTFNSPSVFEKLKENAIADEFLLQGELKFNLIN